MSTPFDSAISESLSELDSVSDVTEPNPNADSLVTCPLSESFCDQIAPQANRYAMSIVRRWCDAEEIVQEAFCRIIQSGRQRAKHDSNLTAVLFTTIRNLAIDQLRKEGRRRFEAIDAGEIANRSNQTDELRLAQIENSVEEFLSQMPNQWSDALRLKVNGGLSYAEITLVMGATHAQVRTWLYRARKQLEQDLTRRGLLDGGETKND